VESDRRSHWRDEDYAAASRITDRVVAELLLNRQQGISLAGIEGGSTPLKPRAFLLRGKVICNFPPIGAAFPVVIVASLFLVLEDLLGHVLRETQPFPFFRMHPSLDGHMVKLVHIMFIVRMNAGSTFVQTIDHFQRFFLVFGIVDIHVADFLAPAWKVFVP